MPFPVPVVILLVLCAACGHPAPPQPAAPPSPRAVPVDAAISPETSVDALVCQYHQCMDICCDKDEVCSHGQLGDGTFSKCLRPHH